MRSFSLVSNGALLLAAAACGDSPSDGSGGEINSQEGWPCDAATGRATCCFPCVY